MSIQNVTTENQKQIGDKLIIFDSNAWLDLYKLPPETIKFIVSSIDFKRQNFWLPNQVYVEFNRHIIKNRDFAVKRFENIKKVSMDGLNQSRNIINHEFTNLSSNEIVHANDLQVIFEDKLKDLIDTLVSGFRDIDVEYQNIVSCISEENDIIQKLIEDLHNISNTNGFAIMELLKIYEEGETRIKYNYPPGITDVKKEKNEDNDTYLSRKFGDLIIWKEILQKVNEEDKDLIFVENEKKADWWEVRSSKKFSNVLLDEFKQITNNKSIEILSLQDFLELYCEDLGLPQEPIKAIVAKSEFLKKLSKHINENSLQIISDMIQEQYLDESLFEEELLGYSFFNGICDSSDNEEMISIKIVDFEILFDSEWDDYSFNCVVEVDVNADITEYVQKYVSNNAEVTIKSKLNIEVTLPLDLSDIDQDVEDGLKNNYISFYGFELLDYSYDSFDVDYSIDEDMFRNR